MQYFIFIKDKKKMFQAKYTFKTNIPKNFFQINSMVKFYTLVTLNSEDVS